jgi:Tol biopolymer transport system component
MGVLAHHPNSHVTLRTSVIVRHQGRICAVGWLALALVSLSVPVAARAAFPGKNGRIAFVSKDLAWPPPDPYQVRPPIEPDLVSASIETVSLRGDRRTLHTFAGPVGEGLNWSPDGRRLVFEQAGDLAILDHDGTGLRQLPRLTEWDSDPAWSAGGRRLVFAGARACLYCNWLHTVRSDGTGLRLIRKAGASSPAWSTSGRIAFVNDDDQYRHPVPPADALYTVKPDGSRLRKLFGRYWGTGQEPDWSPDGSRIAFRALHRIFALGANGRGLRRLTKRYSTPGDSEPTWSPDGRYIAFIRDYDLYLMRSNGRGLRRLIDVPEQDPNDPTRQWTELSSPSWQPLR